MIRPEHLRVEVIRPTLERLRLHSPAAEKLLLGTAIAESTVGGETFLRQMGTGPALGIYQIEPGTNADVWQHYLSFRPLLAGRVLCFSAGAYAREEQLVWNLAYATAIARLVYRRAPEPLPAPGDVVAIAAYWKRHFNTRRGKGTVEGFITKAGRHLR